MKSVANIFRHIYRHPLNSNRRSKAIIEFLRWQLGARILGKRAEIRWVNDSRFLVGIGESGLTGNIYVGLMEYADMAFLIHAIRPSETFVDVGANAGAYTILASKVAKVRAIAFEPIPSSVDKLMDQIHLNRIEDLVVVKNKGVAEKKGRLHFTTEHDTMNRVSLDEGNETTATVAVTSLDDELDPDARYFLKIDVEGFEHKVLEGAERLFASDRVPAIIIELNGSGEKYGYSNDAVHGKLLAFGFRPVAYEPRNRLLTPLESYNETSGNTLYVKDLADIVERCRSAPQHVIHTADGITI